MRKMVEAFVILSTTSNCRLDAIWGIDMLGIACKQAGLAADKTMEPQGVL
jgi:hypothetical protein